MITMTPRIDPATQMPIGPTLFMTERNEHEVRCGMCARPLYVDEESYQQGNSGLDNPYRCDVCAEFES